MFSGYRKPETYVIESENNAAMHNNIGLSYMKDYWWYPAIQEFKIAISLSPNVQASSVYYNNLGECYMTTLKHLLPKCIRSRYENQNHYYSDYYCFDRLFNI